MKSYIQGLITCILITASTIMFMGAQKEISLFSSLEKKRKSVRNIFPSSVTESKADMFIVDYLIGLDNDVQFLEADVQIISERFSELNNSVRLNTEMISWLSGKISELTK